MFYMMFYVFIYDVFVQEKTSPAVEENKREQALFNIDALLFSFYYQLQASCSTVHASKPAVCIDFRCAPSASAVRRTAAMLECRTARP